jgi:hypothetical protein
MLLDPQRFVLACLTLFVRRRLKGDGAMLRYLPIVAFLASISELAMAGAETTPPKTIACDAKASSAEHLAVKEFRRYIYLRTGALLPIVTNMKARLTAT